MKDQVSLTALKERSHTQCMRVWKVRCSRLSSHWISLTALNFKRGPLTKYETITTNGGMQGRIGTCYYIVQAPSWDDAVRQVRRVLKKRGIEDTVEDDYPFEITTKVIDWYEPPVD